MKNTKDSLGDRMKGYESVSKTVLMKRVPVVIRLDGKAFHTFTRGFVKPFDKVLIKTMQETTKYLCENIQGCVIGYTQSDEITLVLCDYEKLKTSPWFDYEVQKLCSVAASMATMKFNKEFERNVIAFENGVFPFDKLEKCFPHDFTPQDVAKVINTYYNAIKKGAMFDARCFNVPKEDVTNCILWRQQDAERNSVQMLGQHHFSHNELQNKSCNMIQDMLFTEKGVNWNDFPASMKRGTAVIKVGETMLNEKTNVFETRMHWLIDEDMPILKGDGRDYIEHLINFKDEVIEGKKTK